MACLVGINLGSYDYESLHAEEFGKALLRGLGWSDCQGVNARWN